jgi:hypothetical protein
MGTIREHLGVAELSASDLDVLTANADAMRVYQRRGLRPPSTRVMGRFPRAAS